MTDETTNTTGTETSTETTQTTDTSAAETTDATAADTGSTETAGSDGADDGTVLGSASTDAGAGDDKGDGSEKAKDTDGDSGKDAVVPEKYELKPFTVGEGEAATQVEIDAGLLQSITPALKDAGVSQEQLEKLAPSVVPEIQKQVLTQLNDDFATMKTSWAKEASEDKEIGGKNWKETQALAARALDHFGAPKDSPFRKELDESGFGNKLEVIRMFRNIGAALKEDSFAEGDGKAVKKDRLEELYPDDIPKK